jgi:hypothetical protein
MSTFGLEKSFDEDKNQRQKPRDTVLSGEAEEIRFP